MAPFSLRPRLPVHTKLRANDAVPRARRDACLAIVPPGESREEFNAAAGEARPRQDLAVTFLVNPQRAREPPSARMRVAARKRSSDFFDVFLSLSLMQY